MNTFGEIYGCRYSVKQKHVGSFASWVFNFSSWCLKKKSVVFELKILNPTFPHRDVCYNIIYGCRYSFEQKHVVSLIQDIFLVASWGLFLNQVTPTFSATDVICKWRKYNIFWHLAFSTCLLSPITFDCEVAAYSFGTTGTGQSNLVLLAATALSILSLFNIELFHLLLYFHAINERTQVSIYLVDVWQDIEN